MFRTFLYVSYTFLFSSLAAGVVGQSPAQAIRPRRAGSPAGSLSGVVMDKTSQLPLPNATVSVPDLQLSTVANDSGVYRFRLLPAGRYLVAVSYIGYKTFSGFVNITGAVQQDFSMTDEAVEGSTVVVTGTSRATQVKRNPVPIVAITHEYLLQNTSTNVIDAISKIPGVNTLTTGPNVSKPVIRGLGYNRILTLFDGVRQEGQQWGDEHGIEVDQYAVDRIEVIKGPASLSYGSDALAGVVNLIPTPSVLDGKLKGDITAEYQSNNGMYGGSAMLGSAKNGFEWMGRVSRKSATNYRDRYDGRVFNTGYRETDGSLSLGIHKSWGYSHLSLSLYDDLQEIPDGSRDSATRKFTRQITEEDDYRPIVSDGELSSYKITPLHQHVQHYRAYLTNNFNIGSGKLAVNVGLQRSVRREYNHPEQPYQDVPGLYLQLNTASYDVKYYFPELNGWNVSLGVNGMLQKNDVTSGTEFIVPSYSQFDIGPFALLKKTFDKLDIAGGLRFDSRSFENQALYVGSDPITKFDKAVAGVDTVGAAMPFYNYHHIFSGMSGSFGATYNFSEQFSAKANISRGYRAPNIAEISANGVHPGTNIYQIGNGDFKPEFSLQEDIGFAYNNKFASVNLSLFNNVISNYIFNQRVLRNDGSDSVIVSGNQTFKFQQGKANLFGGELSVDIHPVKALHVENSIAAVYGLNRNIPVNLKSDSNRYVPFIPPLHGVSEIKLDVAGRSQRLRNAFVKAELEWYGAQNRVYLTDNTETATPGYVLFNAGAGCGFANKNGKTFLNVSIIANNIFNIGYQDHLNRLKYFEPYQYSPTGHYGIYNMGRNIAFKVDFPFDSFL